MDALLLATFNALWQGAALVAFVVLALRAGLRRNATTACVVWSVTFVVVAALPAIDVALARPPAVSSPARPTMLQTVRVSPLAAARTARTQLRVVRSAGFSSEQREALTRVAVQPRPAGFGDRVRSAASGTLENVDAFATHVGAGATGFARSWGPAIVIAWALVALTLLARLALAYAAVVRVKRGATPLADPRFETRLRAAGHRRRAMVASSDAVEIPCAIGFHRPMILIPSALVASLDHDDLARIVLHESAHLQRFDDCVNALEQVVCALQFFQPALLFTRRRIDFEREVACDDRVLEDSGEPLRYAECLARIVQRQVRGRQVAVVPGFVLRRTQVVARVRRIVDRSRDASPQLRIGAPALGAAVLAATLGIAHVQVPVVAPVAPETIAPPASSRVPAVTRTAPQAPRAAPDVDVDGPTSIAVKVRKVTHPIVLRHVHQVTNAAPEVIVVRAPRSVLRVAQRPVPLPPIDVPRLAPVGGSVTVASKTRVRSYVYLYNAPDMLTGKMSDGRLVVQVPRVSVKLQLSDEHLHAAAASVARAEAVAQSSGTSDVLILRSVSRHDDLLSAIDDAKYPRPSVDELIELKNHGVSGASVRAMGALGSARPSLAQLVPLADQGIDATYFGAMQRSLATAPTIDQVISLRQQGVSARWLEAFAAGGYPKLSIDDAIAFAQQGVSPAYVHGMLDVGLKNLSPAQLIELRNHGVDAAFVRRLNEHGYRNLGVGDLIRLRDSGI